MRKEVYGAVFSCVVFVFASRKVPGLQCRENGYSVRHSRGSSGFVRRAKHLVRASVGCSLVVSFGLQARACVRVSASGWVAWTRETWCAGPSAGLRPKGFGTTRWKVRGHLTGTSRATRVRDLRSTRWRRAFSGSSLCLKERDLNGILGNSGVDFSIVIMYLDSGFWTATV